jgi:tetratricopeptide (TPR) repeat protein
VIKDLQLSFILDSFRARLLLVMCCLICYAGSIRNDYAMDDDFAVYQNAYVQQGIKGIPDILTHPYYRDANLSVDYRPVAGITFALEKQFFGNNPHISHFINLLLYTICVLLILTLMTDVFAIGIVPAFFITLFFAIHPAHVEVVASIKNREEILALLFSVVAFISSYRIFQQASTAGIAKYILLTMLCILLSFASKMSSLPIIGVILTFFYFKGYYRRPWLFYGMAALILIFSAVYFFTLLRQLNRPIYDLENPLVNYHDLSTKVGTTAAALLFYFRFLWVPYPFSFFYGYNTIPVIQADQPIAVLSVFLHLSLFVYGLIFFFRKQLIGFFILSYFIFISIYSNILIPYTGIVSERAVYFASLWFIAAVCLGIYQRFFVGEKTTAAIRRSIVAFGSMLLIVYGTLDINRVNQWHDTVCLMGADIGHLENSTLANYFYACVLKSKAEESRGTAIQNKYLSESRQYLYQTIAISPGYPYGYFRLGQIYRYDRYLPDSAYYYFKKAYSLNPSLTDVAYQYGRLEYEYGNLQVSNDIFAALYQKIPNDTFTVFYHALLLLRTGHTAEGHQVNSVFLKMAPTYYQSHFNEGIYYQLIGDSAAAAQSYETAIRLGCTDQTVYRFLIGYYQKQGRTDEANKYNKLLQ